MIARGHASWVLTALISGGCGFPDANQEYPVIQARVETDPVPSQDDAADDPAIWVNPQNPEQSLIFGTDKKSGLMVFGLDGRQLQYLAAGRLNNIDIRPDPAAPEAASILAASAREPSEVVLFRLDHATGKVSELVRHDVGLENPYGICMTVMPNQTLNIVVTSQDGTVAQFRIEATKNLAETRRFKLVTQPEGCVIDDASGQLYIGEEGRGIWLSSVRDDPAEPPTLFADINDGILKPDVEGLTLLQYGDRNLVLASSQGDNSYAAYDAADGKHVVSFRIGDSAKIDGTHETDGIDATSIPLPGHPQGMLVVQDGVNTNPEAPQNFKLVSLEDVYSLIR